jgi:hypothetical protein
MHPLDTICLVAAIVSCCLCCVITGNKARYQPKPQWQPFGEPRYHEEAGRFADLAPQRRSQPTLMRESPRHPSV